MKSVFLFLLSVGLLCSCQQTRSNNEPINKQIGEYIRKTCEENKPCKIQIKDAIDFVWDKIYIFDDSVEDDVISKVLETKFSHSSLNYSRKWFFLKDNQIVRTEEHILYQIDEPVDSGDVLLTVDNPQSQERFIILSRDSLFEVSTNKLSDNEFYYYLHCLNCP